MSSPGADLSFREPCEDDSCQNKGQLTFYCEKCECSFCDTCWGKQSAHKPKKRGFVGHAHEKIDRLVVERYQNIFEPPSSIDNQDALYKDEEDATWFGIGHNRAGDPVFEDYGRYTTLMAESILPTPKVRYPYLASFIGQTGKSTNLDYIDGFFNPIIGAGKSAVVKLLINYQDMKVNRTAEAKFSSPLVGSVNDNIPVSADVHLYADPETFLTDIPLLYADCEGLEGGESPPKSVLYKMRDSVLENGLPHKIPSEYGSREHEKLSRKRNKVSRKISWALGDKEKSKREFAVTELYPKLLYTFSDVVVFVLRNPKYVG